MINPLKVIAKRWFGLGGDQLIYTGGTSLPVLAANNRLSSSGVLINEQTAITIPAMFHAMRLYAQVIGYLDWDLIAIDEENDEDGNRYTKRSVARDHPSHRLVHDDPNEFQVSSSFRETLICHRFLYGNAYAYIERNGNMRPTAMIPLLPDRTYPTRENGRLQFVTEINNVKQVLEPNEVFHLPGVSMNGLTGVPIVKLMSSTLGLTKAEEEWAAKFFNNGMNIGGTIESPTKLSDAAFTNLKASMQEKHSGLGNAFKWMLLEEGLKATPFTIDAEKSQLIASRQFSLGDMARISGLAPHLLYDLSRSTNNNISWQGIEAVNYSFKPLAVKMCQEGNRKLLYESEKGRYEFRIDLQPLTVGDAKTEAEKDQILFNTCSLTPNEIRSKNGRNPIKGGDELFVNIATLPLNLVVQQTLAGIQQKLAGIEQAKAQTQQTQVSAAVQATSITKDDLQQVLTDAIKQAAQAGADTAPASLNDEPTPEGGATIEDGPAVNVKEVQNIDGDEPDADDVEPYRSAIALAPVARDTVARLMRRECKAVGKAVERSQNDRDALGAWMGSYAAETRQAVANALLPLCESVGGLTGRTPDASALAQQWIDETTADIGRLSPDSTADDADLMFEGWNGERVERTVNAIVGNNE